MGLEVVLETDLNARLLLVEDDPTVRGSVARALRRQGCEVVDVPDADEAMEAAREGQFDVALLDVGLPDGRSGLDVLRALKLHDPAIECIVFTGDASAPMAVEAYAAGAVEFFEKPITDWNRFQQVMRRAIRLSRLTRERLEHGDPAAREGAQGVVRKLLVGNSKAMEELRGMIERLAPRNTTLLLLGPSGAGKTSVAKALHAAGGRLGRFEHVDVGRLDGATMTSELFGHEKGAFTGADDRYLGAFERAKDGTILLDEIGDLAPDLQRKLLQVLEERSFTRMRGDAMIPMSARVIAATHRDIEELVRQGGFRADLANRLGIRITVPGLADRRDDIPQLVYTFLKDAVAREKLDVRSVPSDVLERLMAMDWSRDNLRGLRNAVERMAVFASGSALDARDLPPDPAKPSSDPGVAVSAYAGLPYAEFKERVLQDHVGAYLTALLEQSGGNVSAAARVAGLHGPNFRRLMRRFSVRE